MSQALVQPADCCTPCADVPITQVPGPAGPPGADGTNGTDGVNAFTVTTAAFTQPAVSANVTVTVADSTWAAVGQVVFVENAGYFSVNSVVDGTHLSLTNLGYAGNAAPAAVIPTAQQVSPGGLRGPAGSTPGSVTLNDISPTKLKGDILADTGANNPNAAMSRLAAGTDGQVLTSLAAQATGLKWQSLTPNAATDNVLPRFDASGTTSPTPLQSSGLLITDTAALQTTAGNARGTSAVDLQPVRAVATQVASGANSVIGGGQNNTASGDDSTVSGGQSNVAGAANAAIGGGGSNVASGINTVVAGGAGNTASNAYAAVVGGAVNTASGNRSAVINGSSNVASALESWVGNGDSNIASKAFSFISNGVAVRAVNYGQHAHNNTNFAGAGDCQASELIWSHHTTDATPTELFLDGPGATERATVPTDTTWAFDIIGVARRDNGDSITFKVEGGIKNTAGTVILVAAVTASVIADGTGGALTIANFTVSADDPNNSLKILVTGIAAQNWRWVAHGRLVEVAF